MNKKLVCVLVANLFAAGGAFAQQMPAFVITGSVSVGGMRTDVDESTRDASYLNQYQDLSSGFLGNLEAKGRSTDGTWFDLFAENLTRNDAYAFIKGGVYDQFKFKLSTDSLRRNFLQNGRTPYAGAGNATQNAVFPQLNQGTWKNLDVGYDRRDNALMFELQTTNPFYLRVDANQVTFNGTKSGAASQGTSPGNGYVDLSLPVDYETRNANFEIGYNTKTVHADISYMVSEFDNGNEWVNWQNGYFGNGMDRTYLAPDNKYARFAGNLTFRQLPWNSTIAARITSDRMTSSATLGTQVLGTTSGGYQATGPSTGNYSGKVNNDTFTLAWAAAPSKAWDTRVYYNYRKRDDQSTLIEYNSTAIPGPFDNEHFNYEKDNYGFDVYFRLNRGNRFGGGYDYLKTDYVGRWDYDQTKDSRWFVEWKNTSFDTLAARLKYQQLKRDANFLLGNEGVNSGDVNYLNRFVSAFDLSSVDQTQWKLLLDWSPLPGLDFSFEGINKENKFKENVLGRQNDKRKEVYLNASYTLASGPRFSVFGDWEEVKYDSMHRILSFGSTASGTYDPATPPTSTNYNWFGNIKDKNTAYGIAADFPVMKRLVIKASYIYYKTNGLVDLALQEGVPASVVRPAALGNWDDSKRTSFNIKGVYDFTKQWTFTAGWAYEKYEYMDDQYAGYQYTVPAANRADSYLNGIYANPNYKANILYALATFRF